MKEHRCECGECVGDRKWLPGHTKARCDGWEDRLTNRVGALELEVSLLRKALSEHMYTAAELAHGYTATELAHGIEE